jgi:hypothetical protein
MAKRNCLKKRGEESLIEWVSIASKEKKNVSSKPNQDPSPSPSSRNPSLLYAGATHHKQIASFKNSTRLMRMFNGQMRKREEEEEEMRKNLRG